MMYEDRLYRAKYGYNCDPTTLLIASLAISAATAVTTVEGQAAQAKSQTAEQQALVAANNATTSTQESAVRANQFQKNQATTQENERATLANQRATATALTGAGESGVQGASVDAMLSDYQQQYNQYRTATMRQSNANASDANYQIDSLRTGNVYQDLSINAPVAQPQYLAAGLNMASSDMGAYRAYNPNAFRANGGG